MFTSIGPMEIGIVLLVVLAVFGPKRLPELGSSLGRSVRGFGRGIKGEDEAGGEKVHPLPMADGEQRPS